MRFRNSLIRHWTILGRTGYLENVENPEITPKKLSGHDVKQHIPKKSEKGVPQRVDFDIDTEGVQKPENPPYRRRSPFGIHFKLPLETRLATILLLRAAFFGPVFETLPNWERIQERGQCHLWEDYF